MKPKLSQKFLRECFAYSATSGEVRWRVRPLYHFENSWRRNNWNARHAGKLAGWLHKPSGYRMVGIKLHFYKLHVLIWVWKKGHWPVVDVDHEDLVRANNRFHNLREATRSNNIANRRRQSNNTSGHKGVCWSKAARKWLAQIKVRGEYKYLGVYEQIEDAVRVYKRAAVQGFGKFARTA